MAYGHWQFYVAHSNSSRRGRRVVSWVYIDAIEWVEMPNTRGMSQYADGGLLQQNHMFPLEVTSIK
jgi:hypothetical protein